MYRNENGKQIKMTDDEITEFNNLQTQAQNDHKNLEDIKKADLDNKISGNKKLLDLGLTQAEATALTGHKPLEEEE